MVKVNLENPFLARPKSVKIGRSYWQAQSKAPTILKQKNTWLKQRNDRNYKAFKNYLQTEGARALNREVKDYLTASNDNTWTSANRNPKNPHLQTRATKGAKSHALWEKEHPVLNAVGTIAGAAPLMAAAYPLGAVAGETVAPALANPYVDTALKAMAVADAGDNIINNRIKTPYDGAMAALELAPVVSPYAIKGYTAVNNSINNSVNRFKDNLRGAESWTGKALSDFVNYPNATIQAIRDGRYVYNKKSLLRNYRAAVDAINQGHNGVNNDYSKMLGYTPSAPKIKIGKSEQLLKRHNSFAFYSPVTGDIKIGFNYPSSNISLPRERLTIVGGHETVHAHNDALNSIYHTPNLGVWDESVGYYVPNPNHPIARKYMDYFRKGPRHGLYPEETFANALGFKQAYPNTTVSKAVQFSNEKEGMNIPPEFIHDYIRYINDTYK